MWHALAPGLVYDGLLTERDAHVFAALCDAAAQLESLARILTPEYVAEQAKAAHYPQAVSLQKHYLKVFNDASTRLGFSPLDRQRLNVPPGPRPDNPFVELNAAEKLFGL